MQDALLFLWDLSIAVSLFGWGRFGLRLCRVKNAPAAVIGVFGVCLWIALGGWLNLLHQLRPVVFFLMDGLGVLLLAADLYLALYLARAKTAPEFPEAAAPERTAFTGRMLLTAGVLCVAALALNGLRPAAWNVDDLDGYAPLAIKTAQLHSIQPDPFSERRVQSSVGGPNFLDAAMYATGDMRSMAFIDSTFGLIVYALGAYSLSRKLKLPSVCVGFVLLSLVFAGVGKSNLTIIYLSAAAFFAVLLLLLFPQPADRISWGRAAAIGIIVGSMTSVRSPNITFFIPLLLIAAALQKFLQPKSRVFAPTLLSLLVAGAVLLPWCIASKTTSGTYLWPLLGQGFHASAFHTIPTPAQLAPLQLAVVLAFPGVALLGLAAVFTWYAGRSWEAHTRSAIIAYLLASALVLPVLAYGIGGGNFDRYAAPVLVPALLVSLAVFFSARSAASRPWRSFGTILQLFTAIYALLVFILPNQEYRHIRSGVYETFNVPEVYPAWIVRLTASQIEDKFEAGRRIQAVIPPSETAIAVMGTDILYDFKRNPIYIADWPGMASPLPGLPLDEGAEQQRQFLLRAGIHYLIEPVDPPHNPADWHGFRVFEHQHHPWYYFAAREGRAHHYSAWMILELLVSDHERDVLGEILKTRPHLYDDGKMAVVKLD